MLKKIIVGILALTVVGAGAAAAAYNLALKQNETVPALIQPEAQTVSASQSNLQGNGAVAQDTAGQPQAAAQESLGEPWQAAGTITAIDATGIQLLQDSGESVYVELGPQDYWQSQGITLETGQQVDITGAVNDGMYHATSLTTRDGDTLVLRTDTLQPMWSGGASNGNGNGNSASTGSSDGTHTPDPQVVVEEWITLEGVLTAINNGTMTILTADGQSVTFQTGKPSFFQEQGVTFAIGDEVSVLGFESNGQFSASDITQLSTGLRVLLRDPNGRPLWGGPGGNGNGNGGNGGGGGNGKGGGN